MLPFFAASGHNLYAKSAYTYLQYMSKPKDEHPNVYKHFEMGFMLCGEVIDSGQGFNLIL